MSEKSDLNDSQRGSDCPAATCYPSCWVFDINRRIYPRDENGKPCGGGPIWREHWREVKIVGETKVSWVTNWGKKIPKKGGHGICFSERELEEASWVQENRQRLCDAVRSLNDFATLKAVSEIIGDNAQGHRSDDENT